MSDVPDNQRAPVAQAAAEPTSPKHLRAEMSDLHARFCRGLGDPKRLLIIIALRHGEKPVSQLAQEIGATQSNASQHLALLRHLNLVVARRVDNNVYYRLADTRIADAVDLLRAIQRDQESRRSLRLTDVPFPIDRESEGSLSCGG